MVAHVGVDIQTEPIMAPLLNDLATIVRACQKDEEKRMAGRWRLSAEEAGLGTEAEVMGIGGDCSISDDGTFAWVED